MYLFYPWKERCVFSRVKATQQFALTLSPSVGLSIRPSYFIFHGVSDTPFCVQVLGKVDERYRVKKSKSVFDFLTYLRETWFPFSYKKVLELIRLITASNEIDDSPSFGQAEFSMTNLFQVKIS